YIEVENYNEDFMTVTPSTGAAFEKIPSGDNAGNWAISATNAGDNYRVTVSLKNTEFMEWMDNDQSSPKTLTFNISKKTLNVTASSLWSTEVYTGKEYELTLDCADEDIGKLRFEGYYTGGGITEETRVDVQPVMSATEKKVTIRLPRLSDKGKYSYILKLAEGIAANSNYTLSFNYDFEVGNKKIDLSSSDIVWRYANSNIDGGTFKSVSESDLDIDGVFNVDYNGYAYRFEVNMLELSEDIRDSIDYEYTGIQSATDVKIGSGDVVEYYTVTFKISPKNGNTSIDIVTEEFSLKWRVNKALFDLTNVKWNYTLPLPYNDKNQEVVLTGLPNGLTAQYR
ncbi:MAG: hypothetical protein K2O95_04360, partial [Clostridia bacterium]|nr:hypothetical protein [Clostridia bacterium]